MLVEYVSLYTSTFLPPGAHFQRPSRALVPPMSPVMIVCVCARHSKTTTVVALQGFPSCWLLLQRVNSAHRGSHQHG